MGARKKFRVVNEVEAQAAKKIVEAHDEYIASLERIGRVAKSITGYNLAFRLFMEYFEFDENTTFEEIDRDTVNEWIDDLRTTISEKTGELRSWKSVNTYISQLQPFLYWCMGAHDEDIKYISTPFTIRKLTGQEPPPKPYTDEEVKLLLQKPDKNNKNPVEWRQWAICNWVLGTGNRCGTFTNIKIKDLDLDKGECALAHTKNKKADVAILSTDLIKVMKEYIKMCMTYNVDRFGSKERYSEAYLFPNEYDKKLTDTAQRQAQKRYAARRGVDRGDIHGLRHTFAYHFAAQRPEDVLVLQKIMGHTDIRTTQLYFQLTKDDVKRLTAGFNPLDSFYSKTNKTRKFKVNK